MKLFPLILLILLAGCSRKSFVPVSAQNPWADDYSAVTALENHASWGTYNVHDPAVRRVGDYYYMYSTDAIFRERRDTPAPGYIQMRRSKDLVRWEFTGWALPEIPAEAVEWVRENSGGRGATNVWAPYMIPCGDRFLLYYCVSAFGRKTSYLGVAEAGKPDGPWKHVGCVVRTNDKSDMNAIDPSIVVDSATGRWWMHYGSYFGGLYCVELDPATGLTMREGDHGHLVARRASWRKDNLEAPEIIWDETRGEYYLFVSYDPLMTTYNVRVGRSKNAEGPFTDFFGLDMRDTTNNFPILVAPYRFEGHAGWAGTAHCGVFAGEDGRWFMAHQGRLAPQNQMMDLHLREMFFTPDGWPVVSPERYAGRAARTFTKSELEGEWEVVRILEPRHERNLEAGQILWGEGELRDGENNESRRVTLERGGPWSVRGEWLDIEIDKEKFVNLRIHAGHDWERETETVLFTGLDARGRSVWGKKIK